ncbi:MAG TPA: aldose epimerase family protein [Gemmatimonadaceae bacterium]|jgi:aldose 1-epimerase|nr:aldose epimerase family protein [Gemmatimonadaceae bacterium]
METYTLESRGGVAVRFIDFGGTIVSVRAPDRDGTLADVVLGYDTLAEYEADRYYFGSLVGRYANRIARGRFTLDGRAHALTINDGPNHLHGGRRGFNKVPWGVVPFVREGNEGAVLTYTSVTGDEGYPGTLTVTVTYTLNGDNELAVDYQATTDEPTPVNLTQHSYFNLGGHDAGDILGHELTLGASRFTPVDANLIPTGELRDVRGTPFDFTKARVVGDAMSADDEQSSIGKGIDHNFVLDRSVGDDRALAFAARLHEPRSGRTLEILTTEPGIQVYAGGTLTPVNGKNGAVYGLHGGIALETQHFPDSPNQPAFPSTILRPGETFSSRTVYRFLVC